MCTHAFESQNGFVVCVLCGECRDPSEYRDFDNRPSDGFFRHTNLSAEREEILLIKNELRKFSQLFDLGIQISTVIPGCTGFMKAHPVVGDIDKMFRDFGIYDDLSKHRVPIMIQMVFMYIYKRTDYRRLIRRTYKVNGLKHQREKDILKKKFFEIQPVLLEMRENYNPFKHTVPPTLTKEIKNRINKLKQNNYTVAEKFLWVSAYWCIGADKAVEFKKLNQINRDHYLSRIFFSDLIRDDRNNQLTYEYHNHGKQFLKRAGLPGLKRIIF